MQAHTRLRSNQRLAKELPPFHPLARVSLLAKELRLAGARFGYVYLQNGTIRGQQKVPSNWIKESIQIGDSAKMSDNSCYTEKGYGYLW